MKAFANGDRHEGDYCLDLRQGRGTYHWANGDCYEGDWEVSSTNVSPLSCVYVRYVSACIQSPCIMCLAVVAHLLVVL